MQARQRVVIARHGESAHNVAQTEAVRNGHHRYDGFIRQPDTPLTQLGIEQAVAAGRRLGRQAPFHRVFVSPHLRAMQAAEAIAKHLPYKPEMRFDERLRERESGIFAGMTEAGIQQKYPDEWERQLREGRYYFRPPGGESFPDVNLRIYSFLTSLKHNFPGHRILVVCHANVIWCFRRVLERLGEADLLKLITDPEQDIANASLTTYATDENGRLRLQEFAAVKQTTQPAAIS